MPAVAVHSPVTVGRFVTSGTGPVTSFTVTVKLVVAPSGLLVQVTTVSPTGNNDPEGWSHEIVVPDVQSLPAVGSANVTLAPHEFSALFAETSACVRTQLEAPLTFTVKLQLSVLPESSVAVQVTVCGEPETVNEEPEG